MLAVRCAVSYHAGAESRSQPEDKRRPCSKCLVYIHPCAIRTARPATQLPWRLVRRCKSSATRQLCNLSLTHSLPLSLFSDILARTPRQSGRSRVAVLSAIRAPSLARARGPPAIPEAGLAQSALRLASLRCRPPAHPARGRHNSRINLDAGSLTAPTTVTRLPALCQPSASTTTLTPAPTSPTACSRARR